jgi:addiction module RelE/StbE family toxin
MKVRWTRHAAMDLAGIAGFIAEDNPKAAVLVAQKIKDSVWKMTRFPRSGRVVPEFGHEGIREIIVGKYRIIYRLESKSVDILSVFEGHRLMPLSPTDIENT